MIHYLKLYGYFLKQRFKILMEYRVNFLIGASSSIFMQGATILTIWVVMRQIPSLNGWTLTEIWFIYGLLTLSKSLNHMFADNLWTLGEQYVRTGMFDRFLVRPIDPLFHLLADRFCHDGVGHFIVGLALVGTAVPTLGITWTPFKLFYLIIAVISGGIIFMALNLLTGVSAFWVMDSVPVIRVVFETHEFAKYPLSIYPKGISILLTWLIPYGFASFYPASYLLNRDVNLLLAWSGPIVAVVLLFISYRFWLFGLRHYSSTGS
ncbi:MAG: ABC transporter permease [Chloroflexi bacterium]|nr:MAG: ABC transporter permease [Chloroflexota bacterium]